MAPSMSVPAARLNRLVHNLAKTFPAATTVAAQREVLAAAGHHLRGKTVLVLPGEGRCLASGRPLNPTAAGNTLREQLSALCGDGLQVTTALLTEHHQQVVALQAQRRAHRPQQVPSLTVRLHWCLRKKTMTAVSERGLSVPAGWGWSEAQVVDHAPAQRTWLVQREYRYTYSSRAGSWWVGAAYLTGIEDGQVWVERVPRHITTVAEALTAITPAAVLRAHTEGRQVLRQGDVWLVELRQGQDNLAALPVSHHFDAARRVLCHRQHGELHVPFRARAYVNLNVAGSRGD